MIDDDNLFNIYDYKFAVKVCEDFPKLINLLAYMEKQLYNYNKYQAISHVTEALYDSKKTMELQLERYKKIKNKKGKK